MTKPCVSYRSITNPLQRISTIQSERSEAGLASDVQTRRTEQLPNVWSMSCGTFFNWLGGDFPLRLTPEPTRTGRTDLDSYLGKRHGDMGDVTQKYIEIWTFLGGHNQIYKHMERWVSQQRTYPVLLEMFKQFRPTGTRVPPMWWKSFLDELVVNDGQWWLMVILPFPSLAFPCAMIDMFSYPIFFMVKYMLKISCSLVMS